MNTDLIPVIVGETASGKTSVGIQLAREINGEVISMDSRKVYRGLPIGTATPEGVWKKGVYLVDGIPHHLMGHLDPDHQYTAGDFARDAENLIRQILDQGKIPILVGGTGFYFKALEQGLPKLPPPNEKRRQEWLDRAEKMGLQTLYEELKRADPQAAAQITSNDKHKIIRALEIFDATGRPYSEWKKDKSPLAKRSYAVMGTRYNKEWVNRRIEERSKFMFESGMIEEAKALLESGFSDQCPALISFGYKEAVQVIRGQRPRSEFLSALIKGTKAYAKRQRTWFRTQTKPTWFDCSETTSKEEISMKMKAFIDKARNGLLYSPSSK